MDPSLPDDARDAPLGARRPLPIAASAVVIGAGFGGLGAALRLAERGVRVVVLEALGYPGGCASTFRRDGFAFEAGATLLSGFGEGQLFRRWIERHGLPVAFDALDPVIEMRAPGWRLAVPPDRARLVDALAGLPGAPPPARTRAFFALQERAADAGWALLDDPGLLPPFGCAGLLAHLRRAPRSLLLARLALRPLASVLEDAGVAGPGPLRTYIDATCQITVQCPSAEAEAPLALGALDYALRGAGHVRGGVGALARALCAAIERLGGEVCFGARARALSRGARGARWRVTTARGEVEAPLVFANLLPQALVGLLEGSGPAAARLAPRGARRLARLGRAVEEGGFGAAMLYRVLRLGDGAPSAPRHLQLIQDEAAPLVEGRHLFCSLSGALDDGRAPPGSRTLTVSTHVPMGRLRALDPAGQARFIDAVHARMRAGLAALAPEWEGAVVYERTASPRTFARFTGRPHGYVGGIPRRAGLGAYGGLWPRPIDRGLYLCGDTVFPGQSALAAAIGGHRAADLALGGRAP